VRVGDLFRHDNSPERLFSMNAMRRAWHQVRRSGKAAGTDGMTLDAFEACRMNSIVYGNKLLMVRIVRSLFVNSLSRRNQANYAQFVFGRYAIKWRRG
jgi:hypothetical protein